MNSIRRYYGCLSTVWSLLPLGECRAYPVVHTGHLSIVPGDRNCIPTYVGDNAAISCIASPINAGSLREALRFVDLHWWSPVACGRAHSTASRLLWNVKRICKRAGLPGAPGESTTCPVAALPERATHFELSSATFSQRSAEIRLSTILSLVDNPS
jgi:hypothetical protein